MARSGKHGNELLHLDILWVHIVHNIVTGIIRMMWLVHATWLAALIRAHVWELFHLDTTPLQQASYLDEGACGRIEALKLALQVLA